MNINEVVNFKCIRNVQEWKVPHNGIYKLEVWGAGMGSNFMGGYSIGYKQLKRGQSLFICCGGMGAMDSYSSTTGGYNGGGESKTYNWLVTSAAGGGATHIAFVGGTLASIGKTLFDQQGLIVAGGSGGNTVYRNPDGSFKWGQDGGAGGGTSGWDSEGGGGTQTTGYAFGQGGNAQNSGSAGGGGGYFGGWAGSGDGAGAKGGGGGGSGWIGGVPNFTYQGTTYRSSTTANVLYGDGKAAITLVAKFPEKYRHIIATPGI